MLVYLIKNSFFKKLYYLASHGLNVREYFFFSVYEFFSIPIPNLNDLFQSASLPLSPVVVISTNEENFHYNDTPCLSDPDVINLVKIPKALVSGFWFCASLISLPQTLR